MALMPDWFRALTATVIVGGSIFLIVHFIVWLVS